MKTYIQISLFSLIFLFFLGLISSPLMDSIEMQNIIPLLWKWDTGVLESPFVWLLILSVVTYIVTIVFARGRVLLLWVIYLIILISIAIIPSVRYNGIGTMYTTSTSHTYWSGDHQDDMYWFVNTNLSLTKGGTLVLKRYISTIGESIYRRYSPVLCDLQNHCFAVWAQKEEFFVRWIQEKDKFPVYDPRRSFIRHMWDIFEYIIQRKLPDPPTTESLSDRYNTIFWK